MMLTQRSSFVFLFILILIMTSALTHSTSCMQKEREALLEFKQGLTDESNFLSSWSTQSLRCCEWTGIRCDAKTGHVVRLDLSRQPEDDHKLEGNNINISALLDPLQHLRVLSLRGNDFTGSEISRRFGNLSNLQALDLSWTYLTVRDLDWLSGLSSLRHLDLSGLKLSQVSNWPTSITKLPSLQELYLGQCSLPDPTTLKLRVDSFPESLKVLDLADNSFSTSIFDWVANISTTNLVHLDLRSSDIQGQIPDVFTNLSSLRFLDLSSNQLKGGIPKSFQNLCSLESLFLRENNFSDRLEESAENFSCAKDTLKFLDLSHNPFTGPFPDLTRYSSLKEVTIDYTSLSGPLSDNLDQLSKLETLSLVGNQLTGSLPGFAGLSSLRILDLTSNQLNGTIAESIGLLSSLEELSLTNNSLYGVVTETHFSNLSRLRVLNFHQNSLTLNLSSEWIPPFQLGELYINHCKVGPAFPSWLKTQSKLEQLAMSQAGIADSLPDWFRNLPSPLKYLDLSFNQIHGHFPDLSSNIYLSDAIDLSSNQFSGALPPFPPYLDTMILSNNMLSETASSLCPNRTLKLSKLLLSDNKLSGKLPDCWTKFTFLISLDLTNNHFSGKLPPSLGLINIQFLHLRNNNFSGGISSLRKAESLGHLDLGGNILSGELPEWLGESLKGLTVLLLPSNKFSGRIPTGLCRLEYLRILDLSHNNLWGVLPHCLGNLTGMASQEIPFGYRAEDRGTLTWKEKNTEFDRNLDSIISFDISTNSLSGEIPESITSLIGLMSVNLSRNNLTGRIPANISQLVNLESLDLSLNQLSGKIPSSVSGLHFLNHLNLSYNKLSGKIPSGSQMSTFEASSYIGNAGLFGPPLTEDFSNANETDHRPDGQNHSKGNGGDDGYVTVGFYISLVIGFVAGFWGFCGSMLLNSSWRYAIFRFWNNVEDWFYVTTRVYKARLMRSSTSSDDN